MLMILMVILMFFGCHSLAMAIRCIKLTHADWLSSDYGKLVSRILFSTRNPKTD